MQSVPPQLHQSSSNEQLSLLVEWKQKYLVEEIITNENTSTEAGLPGENVNVIQNFCPSSLIINTTSCQKRSLCYYIWRH